MKGPLYAGMHYAGGPAGLTQPKPGRLTVTARSYRIRQDSRGRWWLDMAEGTRAAGSVDYDTREDAEAGAIEWLDTE